MKITSTAFDDGAEIPKRHGYKYGNVSPALQISDIPNGAKSLALIMDDPDAMGAVGKVWVHWLLWNVVPDANGAMEISIPEGSAAGGVSGETDFGECRYGGPAPPDKRHTYVFRAYALDSVLDIKECSKRAELEQAIKSRTTKEAVLTGTFAP